MFLNQQDDNYTTYKTNGDYLYKKRKYEDALTAYDQVRHLLDTVIE